MGMHLYRRASYGRALYGRGYAPYRHASLIAKIINSRNYLAPKLPAQVTCPEASRREADEDGMYAKESDGDTRRLKSAI
jgi:hypothetical protein